MCLCAWSQLFRKLWFLIFPNFSFLLPQLWQQDTAGFNILLFQCTIGVKCHNCALRSIGIVIAVDEDDDNDDF